MGKIVRQKSETYDVVSAAKKRVINVFQHKKPVFMAFSGGKDSICMAGVVLELIRAGKINPKQLIVVFIDEEAIFPDVERIVHEWRKTFLLEGAQFWWMCLEVKHFNCFNLLSEDETFICWDRTKRDVWVRPMPEVAYTSHPKLKPVKDSYQDFLERVTKGYANIVGVRVTESVQRLLSFLDEKGNGEGPLIKPIYDWTDNDIWLFIKQRELDFPIEYLYLWQIGNSRPQLRISQFFSVDTAKNLINLQEFYPDLMERVTQREPNAYLATLYWNTEMFRRAGGGKKKEEDTFDYRGKVLEMLADIPAHFYTENSRAVARNYRKLVFHLGQWAHWRDWKKIYGALVGGDPKGRTLRSLYTALPDRGRSEKRS